MKRVIFFLFISLFSCTIYSQTDVNDIIDNKKNDQTDVTSVTDVNDIIENKKIELNNNKGWSVSAGLSNFIMHGDLRSTGTADLGNFWNFGAYAYVDKMFNPLFGLEFKVNYSKASGGAQVFSNVYDILYVNQGTITKDIYFKGTTYGAELNMILSFSNLYNANTDKWHVTGYFGGGYHLYDSALYRKKANGIDDLLVDFGNNSARTIDNQAGSLFLSAQLGIKYSISKRIDLEIRPSWYLNFEDHLDATISDKQNWESFFVTNVGIVFNIGKKKTLTIDSQNKFKIVDTDKDGVMEELDNEPNTPIESEVYGDGTSVDSDKDGVPDYIDKCPFEKGRADNDGCPFIGDKDRDGIPDREDKCPDVKGLEIFQGCPDANSLRIIELVAIMSYSKNIYFNTGSNTIRSGFYYTMLDDVAEIMLRNKDVTFSVSGFTDNVGEEDYNLKLSNRRANEARNFLIERGVESDRISAEGYGKLDPKYTNDTENGKQLNRRVEIKSVGYYKTKTKLKLEDFDKN